MKELSSSGRDENSYARPNHGRKDYISHCVNLEFETSIGNIIGFTLYKNPQIKEFVEQLNVWWVIRLTKGIESSG